MRGEWGLEAHWAPWSAVGSSYPGPAHAGAGSYFWGSAALAGRERAQRLAATMVSLPDCVCFPPAVSGTGCPRPKQLKMIVWAPESCFVQT